MPAKVPTKCLARNAWHLAARRRDERRERDGFMLNRCSRSRSLVEHDLSEDRLPARIKSGAGFLPIML
jgi:hypothetical protein